MRVADMSQDQNTIPEWAFSKACFLADRKPHHVKQMWSDKSERRAIEALATYIAAHEQPPTDRKLLCAREAMARNCDFPESAASYRNGMWDHAGVLKHCMEAIELWESGFGKD